MNVSLHPHWHEPVAAPRIVQEGAHWLALEKPAGWLVHPTKPTGEPTLIDWLRQERPGEAWHLVNRLDRETSGLVLAARGAQAAGAFGKMTEARRIRKEYLALVHGEAPEHLRIDQPLDRLSKYQDTAIYMKQGVVPGGYPACTELVRLGFRHLERRAEVHPLSLLRLQLHTGRLHQIRVHLAWAGFPVIGDKLYGPHPQAYLDFIRDGWTSSLAQLLWLPRHALHAARLEFEWKGETVEVRSPLSEDLQGFWNQALM